MNCHFHEHDIPDAQGKRRVRCRRCGWITPPIATPLERIRAACKAWPHWWEMGYWLAIFLAAAGITKGRWNWLRGMLRLGPCECGQRQEAINSAGARFARWLVSLRLGE